jgi:hypothetical protein
MHDRGKRDTRLLRQRNCKRRRAMRGQAFDEAVGQIAGGTGVSVGTAIDTVAVGFGCGILGGNKAAPHADFAVMV